MHRRDQSQDGVTTTEPERRQNRVDGVAIIAQSTRVRQPNLATSQRKLTSTGTTRNPSVSSTDICNWAGWSRATVLQLIIICERTTTFAIFSHWTRVTLRCEVLSLAAYRARQREHITPILRTLHWLPIRMRIMFKIICTYFPTNVRSAQSLTTFRKHLKTCLFRRHTYLA